MFVTGNGNGRVEVFALSDDGTLARPTADYILGKPSAYARRSAAGHWSENEVEFPGSVAIDHINQRLFVVDSGTGAGYPGVGSQIMVFDIHPDRIRTGAPVIGVLGQPDAAGKSIGLARNHVARGPSVAVDDVNQRLFVGDGGNNRVLVFDIRPEVFDTGMDATIVLGQTSFETRESGVAADTLNRPGSVAYDAANGRLFIADRGNSRILIFDASPQSLQTGAAAIDVMGQPDFTTNTPHSGLDEFALGGLTYDLRTDRLFIAESHSRIEHMRITVYDVAPGRSLRDPQPIAVLGKPGFGAYDPIVSREQSVWPRLGASSIDPERQLLVATEGYPGGNRAMIWDISPENLRNGAPAAEVVGHLDDEMNSDFTRRSANDRVNGRNVYPRDVALDPIDHRLMAIDQYNNRVLVWQLDSQNRVLEREAGWVIGQPDLYTAELRPMGPNTIKIPLAVAYDTADKRIFVSDGWGNRVMVFDADPDRLESGADAIAALGQPDLSSTAPARTRAGIDFDTRVGTGITPGRPRGTGLAYDPVHKRVFVSDGGNNRVLVYDAAPGELRTGMPASVVIGQPDFSSGERGLSATGFRQPAALLYDAKHHRLFVADGGNNRVLVFDARPEPLANGAAAIAVIGQPDFSSADRLRSRAGLDGPDGLAYDTELDRLFVSDHGNDRVTIYDAAPERLSNMPEALFVIGQKDFTTRELGPVRANELWDPRGLAFDSEHQRLYVSQGFAAIIMIHDMARSTYEFDAAAGAVQAYQSAGADTEQVTTSGYAVAAAGGALAGGTAVVTSMKTYFDPASQRESRILVSETGYAAPAAVRAATVFVGGGDRVTTTIHATNTGVRGAELHFELRDSEGRSVDTADRVLEAGGNLSARVSDLFAVSVAGTVTITSSVEIAVIAMQGTTNSRGEEIITAAPVAYDTGAARPSRVTIPRIDVGGGFATRVVLLNPSDSAIEGTIDFVSAAGDPLAVIDGQSRVRYSIAARGTFTVELRGDDSAAERGFAIVTAGAEAPVASAIVSVRAGGTLITEGATGSGSANEAWFPIDTYTSMVRHGKIGFRVTIANGDGRPADVRLILYDPDGNEIRRMNQIIPARRQLEFSQVDLANRGRFKGSVRIVSDVPVSTVAHQLTTNVRDELILTNLPSIRAAAGAGQIVFPRYVDGPELATQLFVLGTGAGPERGAIEFYDPAGEPLMVILR